MEEERRAASDRIHVTVPGVLRGFDAMEVGDRYVLIAGDGCVPYRTSWRVVQSYDSRSVLDLLERDFGTHGAPLVLRLDRATQHKTAEIREFLKAHQVLVLHGPPHLPRYYGQLERQNREHRAWLAAECGDNLDEIVAAMIEALNTRWRRCTLGWKTPAELWDRRPALRVDRGELREEVKDYEARLHRHLDGHDGPADLAERLAIQHVLRRRGFLLRKKGGWVEGGGLLTLTHRGKAVDGSEVQQGRTRPQLSHRAWKPGDTAAGFPQRQQAGNASSRNRPSISFRPNQRNGSVK
jgi:hypothetical protein